MKQNKSGFIWFYNFILFDEATANAKTRFLNVGHMRVVDCRYFSGKLA